MTTNQRVARFESGLPTEKIPVYKTGIFYYICYIKLRIKNEKTGSI